MSRSMKSTIIALSFLLMACQREEKKFDSRSWSAIDGNNFSQQREPLINDLITNHLFKGMSYKQLTHLLGEPEIREGRTIIGYTLYVSYGWGIDPVEGRDLMIQLAQDSTVVNYKIKEWEK